MNTGKSCVRELAGWGFDENECRPRSLTEESEQRAHACLAARGTFEDKSALCEPQGNEDRSFLEHQHRVDLHAEMDGLEWLLGIVDLRLLLAFQRRLILGSPFSENPSLTGIDWPSLVKLCFGGPHSTDCEIIRNETSIVFQSDNPNLQFRMTSDPANPIHIHTGSPFLEVAEYRNRWFLRDGYHRAYRLLQAGVFRVPAVIVKARTLAELGPVHPWFYPEEVLFSSKPPYVTDFLEDDVVLEYDRPSHVKTIRLTVEESFGPITVSGEQQ